MADDEHRQIESAENEKSSERFQNFRQRKQGHSDSERHKENVQFRRKNSRRKRLGTAYG